MQLQIWTLALGALGNMQVASPYTIHTPSASLVDSNSMENTTAASLRPARSGLGTRASIPHDVPEHPHCTFKGKDSRMFMVFSKDFGRNDETSRDGCGSDMLHHLRQECGGWIVSWTCVGTPKGDHSSFMEFKVPIGTTTAGPDCVERAFKSASGSERQQVMHCCSRGDYDCRKRNCEEYRKTNPGLKC